MTTRRHKNTYRWLLSSARALFDLSLALTVTAVVFELLESYSSGLAVLARPLVTLAIGLMVLGALLVPGPSRVIFYWLADARARFAASSFSRRLRQDAGRLREAFSGSAPAGLAVRGCKAWRPRSLRLPRVVHNGCRQSGRRW